MNPKLVEFEGLKEQYRKAVRKWSKTHSVPLRDEKCWWYMFISNKHKVTMSYVSLHARTHARTYVCTVICTQIFLYAFLYIYIHISIYTHLCYLNLTSMGAHDHNFWQSRCLNGSNSWQSTRAPCAFMMAIAIYRLTYSNTQKGRKVKSYTFTQWLLFYLVGGCDNWSCEWIWVVFLSFSCGTPCWYSFQH